MGEGRLRQTLTPSSEKATIGHMQGNSRTSSQKRFITVSEERRKGGKRVELLGALNMARFLGRGGLGEEGKVEKKAPWGMPRLEWGKMRETA